MTTELPGCKEFFFWGILILTVLSLIMGLISVKREQSKEKKQLIKFAMFLHEEIGESGKDSSGYFWYYQGYKLRKDELYELYKRQ